MKKDYTEIDKKALEMFKKGMSLTKISTELKTDRGRLTKRLKDNFDINITPNGRKYHCNDNAFSNIRTEEQAYWLGFLLADGCIRNDRYIVDVTLAERDKNHLVKLNCFLNSDYKITSRQTKYKKDGKEFASYRTYFISKQICTDLATYGCVENKTYKNSYFPDFKNKDLNRACIRGFFDGDGSICIANKNKGRIDKITITSYSIDILKKIYEILNRYISIDKIVIYDSNGKRTPSLYFSATKAQKVLDFLYTDSTVYLERKYHTYKAYCRP